MSESITTIPDFLLGLGMFFVFFTFPLGVFYFWGRIFLYKFDQNKVKYWLISFWSLLPFSFALLGKNSLIFCLSALFVGAASGYILELFCVYLDNRKTHYNGDNSIYIRFLGRFRSNSKSSSSSSRSSSSSSNRSNFGGGGFSGGGGSGKW